MPMFALLILLSLDGTSGKRLEVGCAAGLQNVSPPDGRAMRATSSKQRWDADNVSFYQNQTKNLNQQFVDVDIYTSLAVFHSSVSGCQPIRNSVTDHNYEKQEH